MLEMISVCFECLFKDACFLFFIILTDINILSCNMEFEWLPSTPIRGLHQLYEHVQHISPTDILKKTLRCKGKAVAVTWLRRRGGRILLGHLEDQPVTHPGLKALQKCSNSGKLIYSCLSLLRSSPCKRQRGFTVHSLSFTCCFRLCRLARKVSLNCGSWEPCVKNTARAQWPHNVSNVRTHKDTGTHLHEVLHLGLQADDSVVQFLIGGENRSKIMFVWNTLIHFTSSKRSCIVFDVKPV